MAKRATQPNKKLVKRHCPCVPRGAAFLCLPVDIDKVSGAKRYKLKSTYTEAQLGTNQN